MATKEYMRKWRAEHPEHKQKLREWRDKNSEKLAEYRRQYHQSHLPEAAEQARRWREGNLFEAAIHRKVASANKRYPERITVQDLRDVIEMSGWKCCWCAKDIVSMRDFTLEHLQPINRSEHLAIACMKCNSAKLPTYGRTRRYTTEERNARINVDRRKKRAYDDQWRRDNKERVNEKQRARYHANIEERRKYFREWQQRKRQS